MRSESEGLIDRAHAYRTNDGTGIVQQTLAPVPLTDFLNQKRSGAPAGEVPRGPYTVRALRIGRERDGSKPGVLIQAQDHAREWVPATITLETAERLHHGHLPGAGEAVRAGGQERDRLVERYPIIKLFMSVH